MSQPLGPSAPVPLKAAFFPLFSLYTSSRQSVKLLKFTDDTTLVGLISGGDESADRWESDHLVTSCRQSNFKTVKMVVDI